MSQRVWRFFPHRRRKQSISAALRQPPRTSSSLRPADAAIAVRNCAGLFWCSILGAVMPKLLLIRHCEATAQYPDAPLTAAGTKAAETLGAGLRDLSPDAVYSSPYERARATVRPFAVLAGLPVRLDDRLRERVLSEHELEDWLDHVRRSFAEPNYRAPGGEGLDEAQSRAAAALADIAAADHRLPVVVSHGNLIAAVLRSMDAAFGFAQWRSLRNPDLFEVELEAGQPVRFVRLDP